MTWEDDFKKTLPSPEHRAHFRRFQKSDLTDEQDVTIRGVVFWKRLEQKLQRERAKTIHADLMPPR